MCKILRLVSSKYKVLKAYIKIELAVLIKVLRSTFQEEMFDILKLGMDEKWRETTDTLFSHLRRQNQRIIECWVLKLIRSEKWGQQKCLYFKPVCKKRKEWWQCRLTCGSRLERNVFRMKVFSTFIEWRKGISGQKTEGVLDCEGDWWKMIPEGQKEMGSAQNGVVGNCYFQIGFEAWIQHSEKSKTHKE